MDSKGEKGAQMEAFNAVKVKLSDYDVLTTLGTGSFGRVRLAKEKKSGEYVAIKMLKKAEILRLKQVDHIISENTILSNIKHPFLIKMLGFAQDERFLYIVLEFVQGGELFTYLRNLGKLENNEAVFFAAQVVSMFEYLHSKNIVYRDLKPENLLIASDGYLKLTDFGFAKYIEGRTYTLCGTPEYLAPEILLNKGHGKPVDWWCLGILTYEMLAGIDPFSDEDPMAIYQKILKGKVKFPRTFDKNAKSLVKHLLVSDLTKRYGNLKGGVNDIKTHRWFAGMDWDALYRKEIPPFYKPSIKSRGDTSNYSSYPDSTELPSAISPSKDPFIGW
jgi:protein kinase A